ncbi:MAG: hypothetical protein M0Q93_00150 [Terrimicrobiaceae bacterium]|jgi:hypothetical protein|nr:hypothetical protein [Terrimicrobiaceae bacterium]
MKMHPTARKREIKRLQELLKTGRFTQSELMSIRGKIGGLVGGKDKDARRRGGLASAKKRWNFTPKK